MYKERMAGYPKLRTGLALSGGSAWGVAHVGAITALVEAGIEIDCIAGTSAGAVVAALYAFGLPLEKMADAAKSLEWKHISRFAYSRLGVRTNAALAKIIIGLIGDKEIEAASTPLAIVATNIENGEEAVMRDGNVAMAVRASSAIPGYFAPVEIGGQLYVDGFLTENLPLSALSQMGANFTIGINLGGAESPAARPRTMGDVIGRSLEILYRESARNPANIPDVLIEPNLGEFHPRSFKEADKLYEEGYRAAQSAIPFIKAKLSVRKRKNAGFFTRMRRYIHI